MTLLLQNTRGPLNWFDAVDNSWILFVGSNDGSKRRVVLLGLGSVVDLDVFLSHILQAVSSKSGYIDFIFFMIRASAFVEETTGSVSPVLL